jgi:DNA-binding CsgD family transcriptional regulator
MEQKISNFDTISEKEDSLINEEICRLLEFGFNHHEMRREVLQSVLRIIPANAPSTIFGVCRSYNPSNPVNHSERYFEYHHLNLPTEQNFAATVRNDIETHINAVSSIIEADIYRLFSQTGVTNLRGLYQKTKILNRKCLRRIAPSAINSIAVEDIFFGWMRSNLNEFWVVAPRRFADRPKFNTHDYELLKVFLRRLYDFRKGWNKENKSRQYLDVLTNREQEAIYHFVGGLKDKETAAQMNISKRTLDTHWQNIFNKIGVSDKILVLDRLGMITNKIPLETEKIAKVI